MSMVDPKSIVVTPIATGSLYTPPPTVRFDSNPNYQWHVPSDYQWQPIQVPAGVGARPPPVITVQATAVNATRTADVTASIVLTDANYAPNYADGTLLPYPTAAAPNSVYVIPTAVPVRPATAESPAPAYSLPPTKKYCYRNTARRPDRRNDGNDRSSPQRTHIRTYAHTHIRTHMRMRMRTTRLVAN